MSEIAAFTAEHVCRLTGLSARQLRYWDNTAFFSPTYIDGYHGRPFGRIYSFRDVVGLRTIALLRKRAPLQELRRVGAWLKERYDAPWASLRFALKGRKVVFFEPGQDVVAVEPRGAGQSLLHIELEPIANEMREQAQRLRERAPEQIGKISRNRYVVRNQPVIAGTRIPTRGIWNYHEAGFSPAEIIREYPRLTEADVRAAIEFEERRRSAA